MTPNEAIQQIKENDCCQWCNEYPNDGCKDCRWGAAIAALEIIAAVKE